MTNVAGPGGITQAELDALIARMDEAPAPAYIRGDIRGYRELTPPADDSTLRPPSGGDTRHGYRHTPEGDAETSRFFASGEARLEVEQSYVSSDLAVLAAVERQHGEAGGLPDQDLSLRVTLVFRRADTGWELGHRHADPLVHPIPFTHLARLARGGVSEADEHAERA